MQYFCELHEYMLIHGFDFCGLYNSFRDESAKQFRWLFKCALYQLVLWEGLVEAGLCLADMWHHGLDCLQ
jgi:hypothetical protein